jgi:hypothetical protein
MKAQTIDVKQATGRILCCTIFRAGGKKLLAKGHLISEEDARMLETEGMNEVWVTELEDGEIGGTTLLCRSRAKSVVERSKSVLPREDERIYLPPNPAVSWWMMSF